MAEILCASPGCKAHIETPVMWRVDGKPWCQSCFWRLMEDMDQRDYIAQRSMDHE